MVIPKRSFLFSLIGMILGISLYYYIKSASIILVLWCLIWFSIASFRRERKVGLILLAFVLFGFGYQALKSVPTPNMGENTYVGFVVESKTNYFLYRSNSVTYYVYEKDNTREIGDCLRIEGVGSKYVSTEYESYFSFSSYLDKKGVTSKIDAKSISSKWDRPLRLREKEKWFLSFFDRETSGFIDSLLFDHRDYSLENITLASELGVLYFLSASGLLFGAILRFFEYLLNFKLGGNKKEWATIGLATLLMPFLLLKPGVVRIYLTRIFKALQNGKDGEYKLDHIDVTSLVGILMIGVVPSLALNFGFLLSIGISIMMVLLMKETSHFKKHKRIVFNALLSISLVIPSLVSRNELHLFSPLYSIIFLPLVYPFIGLSWISFLSVPMTSVLGVYSSFLRGALSVIEKVDVTIPTGYWSDSLIVVYYTLYINIWFWHDIGITNVRNIALTVLSGVIILNPIPYNWVFQEAVYFINVGQGDSMLIKSKSATIMIDTGGNTSFDIANEVLMPFLRKEKIYKIDYLITTHQDEDHCGGVSTLKAKYKVRNILDYNSTFPIVTKSLTLSNLNHYWHDGDDENDKSLVLYTEFMNRKWLIMGDAPKSVEKSILEDYPNLDCDILKVGHHGSDTSSSPEFIKAISPSEAIISVGAKNKYGHPHDEVLSILTHYGARIRRTDIEGTISYKRYVTPF